MINRIKNIFYNSLVNYGVVSYKSNRGKDLFSMLLRIACGCWIVPYMELNNKEVSMGMQILFGISILLVYAGAYAGSIAGRRIPQVGKYTILNHVVTFASGLVTAIVLFAITELVIHRSFSIHYLPHWFSVYIEILVFSSALMWISGLFKSFRLRNALYKITDDDGIEEVERVFGYVAKPGVFSNTVNVRRIGWTEKRWTAQTYNYYFGLIGLSARLAFALCYGITVGFVLAGIGTIASIVRTANSWAPFEGLKGVYTSQALNQS